MILKKSFLICSLLLAGCSSTPVEKSCPRTKIVDNTTHKWNKRDDQVVKSVRTRCKTVTGLPCLKTFVKRRKHDYYAECGNP